MSMSLCSQAQSRKSRSLRIPALKWAEKQEKIRRLYIEDGNTLEEVMSALKKEGFTASRHQWTRQLDKWGFMKNSTKRRKSAMQNSPLGQVGSQFQGQRTSDDGVLDMHNTNEQPIPVITNRPVNGHPHIPVINFNQHGSDPLSIVFIHRAPFDQSHSHTVQCECGRSIIIEIPSDPLEPIGIRYSNQADPTVPAGPSISPLQNRAFDEFRPVDAADRAIAHANNVFDPNTNEASDFTFPQDTSMTGDDAWEKSGSGIHSDDLGFDFEI